MTIASRQTQNASRQTQKAVRFFGVAAVCILCVAVSQPSSAVTIGHTDTFEIVTVHNWEGDSPPTILDTNGPAGDGDRFVMVDANGANGPGSRLAVFNRSAEWTGDYIATGVSAVSVDMMNPVDSPQLEMRLVLFGNGETDTRWTSVEPTVLPGDGLWKTVVFDIGDEALTSVAGSANYEVSLSDVVRAMVRHDAGTPSRGGTTIQAEIGFDNFTILGFTPLCCDFDGSGDLNLGDVNLLLQAVANSSNDAQFDVDADGVVQRDDITSLITDSDKLNTYIGDANLDGEFTSDDLVAFFAAGEYEDAIVGNSRWQTGDWTGDAEFTSSDLVAAFVDGGFELGPRSATAAVPEPTSLLFLGLLIPGFRLRVRAACGN